MRDLYDIYFFISILGVKPNIPTLNQRLKHVYSGRSNRSKAMSMDELISKLEHTRTSIDAKTLNAELSALLSKEERAGLDLKIKVAIHRLKDMLTA